MFCNQCEQTANGKACTVNGVCGKNPDVSALQDLLIFSLEGLALIAQEGRRVGVNDAKVNEFTPEALFSTMTNVDFDPERLAALIEKSVEIRERLKNLVRSAGGRTVFEHPSVSFIPQDSIEGLVRQGRELAERGTRAEEDADIESLKDTLLFGLKGVAAYADHAQILGKSDDRIYSFMHTALSMLTKKGIGLDEWLAMVLKCGEANLWAMELLDAAHTGAYGHPIPTRVPLGAKKGKAILVSGHDLKDIDEILRQSEGKGINVYTHGEMLPAHGYPALKKYPHFYGHYGTAWQNQQKEFARFPGAIVMTTNCLQRPLQSYHDNIFTTGPAGWPEVRHIKDKDFSAVLKKAMEMQGFTEDIPGGEVVTGFARNAVLGVADRVIDAVKAGLIRHFFLVGGCDGARPGRNYYTRFVELAPKDTVILTLACGKFRFFDKDLGNIGGIPRLLDIGQCNDAYSAIQIALALSKAFGKGVNDLPLSFVLSWYEQKAVAILLTLLHLGIKNIRLGPTLPAFVTPNVLDVLVKNFGIRPIASTPEEDIKEILGKGAE